MKNIFQMTTKNPSLFLVFNVMHFVVRYDSGKATAAPSR